MGKSTGLTILAFVIVLVPCISGCEEDMPGVIGPGNGPETYLSPQHSLAWSPDRVMRAGSSRLPAAYLLSCACPRSPTRSLELHTRRDCELSM